MLMHSVLSLLAVGLCLNKVQSKWRLHLFGSATLLVCGDGQEFDTRRSGVFLMFQTKATRGKVT